MDAIANQDRARDLAAFIDDGWVASVPKSDRYGEVTRVKVARENNVDPAQVSILKVCLDHPGVAAVDCLDCAPIEGE